MYMIETGWPKQKTEREKLFWSQTRPGYASWSPAVTAELRPYSQLRAQKGPRAEYTRAAHVQIGICVVVMIYTSCAEQKTALQKLSVVPNARQRRPVVNSCNGAHARGATRTSGTCVLGAGKRVASTSGRVFATHTTCTQP